jgi:hypothetical protein
VIYDLIVAIFRRAAGGKIGTKKLLKKYFK